MKVNRRGFFGVLLAVSLLSQIGCSKKVEECDCPRTTSETMTTSEYEELLAQLVADGTIDETSEEYAVISRRIRRNKDVALLFGDDWRDLGYEPGALWTVPENPMQNCPFEIHWRPCFQAEECRFPVTPESGSFTEILVVQPASEDLDSGLMDIGEVYETFERETITNGECVEYVFEHPGVAKAGMWEVSITATEPENSDCVGFSGIDVAENDTRILQLEVGCHCGNQDSYNVAMLTEPYLDFTTDHLRWNLQFPYVSCMDHPAETKTITETLEIVKDSDGSVVYEHSDDFGFLMGTTEGHEYPLGGDADKPPLEAGVEYTVTIALAGGDCSCIDRGYGEDNGQTFSFSF